MERKEKKTLLRATKNMKSWSAMKEHNTKIEASHHPVNQNPIYY